LGFLCAAQKQLVVGGLAGGAAAIFVGLCDMLTTAPPVSLRNEQICLLTLGTLWLQQWPLVEEAQAGAVMRRRSYIAQAD